MSERADDETVQSVQQRAEEFAQALHVRLAIEHARRRIPRAPLQVQEASVIGPIGTVVTLAGRTRCAPWLEALPVAAGIGRAVWDEPCERWVALPSNVPRVKHVALSVSGDSMTPFLHAGDVLLVRLETRIAVGMVVVAQHPDHGYVVKHVARVTKRHITLESFNRRYEPFELEHDPRLIVGVVSHVLTA